MSGLFEFWQSGDWLPEIEDELRMEQAMNFQIYYLSHGVEKKARVDASNEQDARAWFARVHPRFTIVRVVDVTPLVRNGYSCW